MMLSIQL